MMGVMISGATGCGYYMVLVFLIKGISCLSDHLHIRWKCERAGGVISKKFCCHLIPVLGYTSKLA